jgi:hypothetical protein
MGTSGAGGVPDKDKVEEAARERARREAPDVAAEMLRRMQEGAAGASRSMPGAEALNDRNTVLRLLSSKELTAELVSRHPHIKEVTGQDPKQMPAHEVVEFRKKLAAEAVKDASDIAKIAKEKGNAEAVKEIANIGERLMIESLDKAKSAPQKPRAEVQDPAAETTRVAVVNQPTTSTLKI